MTIESRAVRYEIDGKAYESLAVWDPAIGAALPGILVAPTFMGRTAFEDGKAEALADLGYVGFSIDIFGVDVKPASIDEAFAAMKALNADRPELARRMTVALEQMRALPEVDAGQTGGIGFCFGGKAVLDLARTGVDIDLVATFHGIFDQPPEPTAETIQAKVLALHGWDDGYADPQAVIAFAAEMTAKTASWELVAYGHTDHGFTSHMRPEMYRAEADTRSWSRLVDFLAESFG